MKRVIGFSILLTITALLSFGVRAAPLPRCSYFRVEIIKKDGDEKGPVWRISKKTDLDRVYAVLNRLGARWKKSPYHQGFAVYAFIDGYDSRQKRCLRIGLPKEVLYPERYFVSRQVDLESDFYDNNDMVWIDSKEYSSILSAFHIKNKWPD